MQAAVQIDGADACHRKKRAIALARALVVQLAESGVTAKIFGSLANGDFGTASDIDILITTCPRSLKYRIESTVEDALDDFAGCALIISHDRWFIDRLATHILSFEDDAEVVFFEGNFTD